MKPLHAPHRRTFGPLDKPEHHNPDPCWCRKSGLRIFPGSDRRRQRRPPRTRPRFCRGLECTAPASARKGGLQNRHTITNRVHGDYERSGLGHSEPRGGFAFAVQRAAGIHLGKRMRQHSATLAETWDINVKYLINEQQQRQRWNQTPQSSEK